ncbi:uncharacterized protein MONOS_15034 [Monocercomonoides exilis]|uniref:uncharacterized protein n=1 Tax=Monocercomonoides exilis TaxID=2049356 RepID=UPI00355AB41E|nr:hypothetical protein MONOS_15034 [Monocercomonoides exilis]|eukprot:MONOS_15034.1-p1 / transcript=MONOS_15034.1 / gene=MONOS_15034 / organism=Monocercomonoides_exilis_PA203 / gene_product=unspecified product / transcript_product=unspecified product / location=Mono_scaffold01131:848-1791(-) / protein_length=208 / sequence_SO=supercontig / SO=protein_coding / is_pseudo=false
MCVPYLLKVALKKVENEEAQKEVEMALLASSSIGIFNSIKKELYLNEIKEIIQHHHEHHNLTRIAYQSAWQFFIDRFFNDKSLEEVIVNELHFPRETAKELEVLTRCIDWKKKEEENEEKGRKETKEEVVLYRWLRMLEIISDRLKEEEKDEKEEAERKRMKMEMFEKLEEEGYEDVIPSLLIIHDIQNDKYECGLSHDIAGYFVNV